MNFIESKTTHKLVLTFLLLTIAPQAFSEGFVFTPLVGFRASDSLENEITEETIDIDNTSSFGFIMSMKYDDNTTYDLYFSRQETDLLPENTGSASNDLGVRIDYIQIGGTVDYQTGKLSPFVTGGLGVTRFSATDQDLSTESNFSLSVGGGLKVPITENVGLRLEGRVFGTAIGGDRAVLCSNGQCIARFESDLFLQFETSLGLAIAF
jgi:opacity protein-like surface antigen